MVGSQQFNCSCKVCIYQFVNLLLFGAYEVFLVYLPKRIQNHVDQRHSAITLHLLIIYDAPHCKHLTLHLGPFNRIYCCIVYLIEKGIDFSN